MIDQLKNLLGQEAVTDEPAELEKFAVGGKFPSVVLFPTHTDQMSKLMTLAQRDNKKVLIAGNNSQSKSGSEIESVDWCISLQRKNKIIEHEAADLIATVEAGTTFFQLQEFLKSHQQFLPLDPFDAGKRTLGGIVATNHVGPWRLRFGTCRDLVLGMKIILPNGTIIRAGGKTVKNVAGYDLSKLFIGSMGTLGIIAEITFKLFPLPATSQTLCAAFNRFDPIPELVASVCSSNLVINRCEYFNSLFIETHFGNNLDLIGKHALLFHIEGHPEMVATTMMRLEKTLTKKNETEIRLFSDFQETELWNQVNRSVSENGKPLFSTHAQMALPKAHWGAAVAAIEKDSIENLSLAIQAHAGNGIINLFWDDADKMKLDHQGLVKKIRHLAETHQGNLIIHQSAQSSRKPELIWGEPDQKFTLMKELKLKYDAHQVLAAGRFIGGL